MAEVELTSSQYNKLKRAFSTINQIRNEIQRDNPKRNISWYDVMGTVHLLDDKSQGNEGKDTNDIVDTFYINNCDCGDW